MTRAPMAVPESKTAAVSVEREKLLDIERGKGLGILLVVYGHLVMQGTLGEQAWYQATKAAIYTFHMPFFMYLSGFVFFFTGAHNALDRNFSAFFAKRFDRLLIPFIVMCLVNVFGKQLAEMFIHVDDGVSGFWQGPWAVISNSPNNPTISIWYLLVLFVYSVLTPILWRLSGRQIGILFLFSLAIFFIPASERFYVARILSYFVFFAAGMVSCKYSAYVLNLFSKYIVVWLIVFAAALYIGRSFPYWLLLCGAASIPFLHALVRLPIFQNDKILLWFGQNSMVIYLLNTIFIGIAKGTYVKILPYQGPWFAFMIVILMMSGTLLPILAKMALQAVPMAGPVYKYVR
ncbi:acyltransferase [Rhizobium sp. MC63]|uniref:Acyltransferase n=1 Tax=Rhizobium mulingense TaxID=3031128 RepID=A0ACC6N5F7_9HYPH|nr:MULTISPECIES: acyltransferase [unclassified Rhizobium]MDF0700198.1 acyltransferase [Rhizobium sp. MC63]MEA3520821.1 acyltransferase [Rhizobium sp. MJ31]